MVRDKVNAKIENGIAIAAKKLRIPKDELLGEAYLWFHQNPGITMNNLVTKLITYQRSKFRGVISMPVNSPSFNDTVNEAFVSLTSDELDPLEIMELKSSFDFYFKSLSGNRKQILGYLTMGYDDDTAGDLCGINRATFLRYRSELLEGLKNALKG